MTFDNLNLTDPILKALSRCGHINPTPIQAQAIPKVLAGRDIIASANTGTGKTAAFVLPMLQRLSAAQSVPVKGLRALVLTPTRELATQILEATRTYSRFLNVHSTAIYGGMPFGDQIRALSQLPAMIVATPGRLIDHIWRGRINLSNVEVLVIDEADRMLDMGFIDDVEFITDAMPEGCQTLLFAATMGEAATRLARKFMKDPDRIEVAQGKITHDKIEQRLHIADGLQHKNRLLRHLCADKAMTRAIVFSGTKRDADVLARELRTEGYAVAALHGDMTQSARNRTMDSMKRGKIRILVATDVAGRGIDITGVSHVINFDLPHCAEESGIAISLASRADLPYLDRIERYIGQSLTVHVIPGLEPSRGFIDSAGSKAGHNGGGKKHGPAGIRTFGRRPKRTGPPRNQAGRQ
jgi:superfamily II DNA/RNA helicase